MGVMSWFFPKEIWDNRYPIRSGRESHIHWNVEGMEESDWTTLSDKWTRYEWVRDRGLVLLHKPAKVMDNTPSEPGPNP